MLANDVYDIDVYTVVRMTRGDANVFMIEFINDLIEKDNQFAERRGGDLDALRQSADDMIDNAMSAEEFLNDGF